MATPGPRLPSEKDEREHDYEAEDHRAWGELRRFLLLVALVMLLYALGRSVAQHYSPGGPRVPVSARPKQQR